MTIVNQGQSNSNVDSLSEDQLFKELTAYDEFFDLGFSEGETEEYKKLLAQLEGELQLPKNPPQVAKKTTKNTQQSGDKKVPYTPKTKSLSNGSHSTASKSGTLKSFSQMWPSAVLQTIQSGAKQGQTPTQIQQQIQYQFGINVSLGDITWVMKGPSSNDYMPNTGSYNGMYSQYTPQLKQLGQGNANWNQGYINNQANNWINQQQAEQVHNQVREAKNKAQEKMVLVNRIMFLIASGEIVLALRTMAQINDRLTRTGIKVLMQKLFKTQQLKRNIMMTMAKNPPPEQLSPDDDPEDVTEAANAAQRNQHFMQVSANALSEIGQQVSGYMDSIAEMKRRLDSFQTSVHDLMTADWRFKSTIARMA